MLHPAIAHIFAEQHETMLMQRLLECGWQRTPDNQWLHPDTGQPHDLDHAIGAEYDRQEQHP